MSNVVMIAVDPHKASNTAAVLDPVSRAVVESARFASSQQGELTARDRGSHRAGRTAARDRVQHPRPG